MGFVARGEGRCKGEEKEDRVERWKRVYEVLRGKGEAMGTRESFMR